MGHEDLQPKSRMQGGNPDPTHMMATAKVRWGFYGAVLVLSVMIYYLVQFRYITEEAPQDQAPAQHSQQQRSGQSPAEQQRP